MRKITEKCWCNLYSREVVIKVTRGNTSQLAQLKKKSGIT